MTNKIQILPEHLCNKIAAGEVVERPASVVKELVENSLDAGASEIRIEVEAGGKRMIRVVDDGEGMSKDDAFLALERHSTSKIRSDDDLFRLRTLGFRGEAMPSIAAVSRLTLQTCQPGAEEGWEIIAEGGTVRRAQAAGVPPGTSIEIRDLFFNTPARRKFLRKEETELGHVGDVVTRLALARPDVRFSLFHNGRRIIDAYGLGSLAVRAASLLGRPVLRQLLPIDAGAGGGCRLHGLLSQPDLHRSSTEALFTYVNGRFIRDRLIHHAVIEGFRHILPRGRYPVAVLFLEIDPALVDVNVHPTKHEVRFREQGAVHDFIVQAVRDALRASDWLGDPLPASPEEPRTCSQTPRSEAVPAAESTACSSHGSIQEPLTGYRRTDPGSVPLLSPSPPEATAANGAAVAGPSLPGMGRTDQKTSGFFSGLRILGQYRRSYILCQDGDDLVLIDQHAAHERIGFERLRDQFWQGAVEAQSLLFPEVIEVDFREAAALTEHLRELGRLGFSIEPFGGRAFNIKAVPRLLQGSEFTSLLRDLTTELSALGRSALAEEAVDRLLITMACHSMVRANQTLTHPQIEALLKDLDSIDFSSRCPHGRPVMKRLALWEIERMFKRS